MDQMPFVIQAGEYVLREALWMVANGPTYDVSQQVEMMIIYEDMFKPFTTATVTLVDTYDLPGGIGQFSRDMFKLTLETPGLPGESRIKLMFHIDSIDGREMRNDRLQAYTLRLVQKEYVADLHRMVSKTFMGTGDSITEMMLTKYIGTDIKLNKDSSTKQIKFTSNFWHPTKVIEYCRLHSISSTEDPLYHFFFNRDGFNFVSLDYLVGKPAVMQLNGSDYLAEVNMDEDSPKFGEARRSPEDEWKIVNNLRWDRHFDYTRMHQSGGFKSDLVIHDILTKKYKVIRHEAISNKPKLNKNNYYTDDTYKNAGAVKFTTARYYDNHDLADVTDTKFMQKRNAVNAAFLQAPIFVDVLGRCDYTVGQKIELKMNRPRAIGDEMSEEDVIDKHLSGNYIITSLSHQFTRSLHVITLELSKESSMITRLPS